MVIACHLFFSFYLPMKQTEKDKPLAIRVVLLKKLFFLFISWFLPCELLTVRRLGKNYAHPKRFLTSLGILLVLAWLNKQSSHSEITVVLLFSGFLTLIYFYQTFLVYFEEEKKKIQRNPLFWGVPLFGLPQNQWFWFLIQPALILGFAFIASFFSKTLFYYFLLSAPLLWIFRSLSFWFYKDKSTQPPWTDISCGQEKPTVSQDRSEIIRWAEKLDLRLNARSLSLVVLGFLALGLLMFYKRDSFLSLFQSKVEISKVLEKEEAKLSSSMPYGWTLKTALSKEELFFDFSQLLEKYKAHPSSFIQQLWNYWKDETAQIVCGQFRANRIEPVWAPFTGIMIVWVPTEASKEGGQPAELWTYVETPASLYKKLSQAFSKQLAPTVTFGKELKAYLFDVTTTNNMMIFHCVIPFSFSLEIAGCTVSQSPRPYYSLNEYQKQGQKIKEYIIKRQRELLAELKNGPLTKEKLEEIKKEAALLKTKLVELDNK